MATITNRPSQKFSVQGRVFNTATKDGIADLIVSVFDVNNGGPRARNGNLDAILDNAIRVGSAISDATGSFTLTYDRDETAANRPGKQQVDLMVVVYATEHENGSADNVIYYSKPPRSNAGRVEAFNIGISPRTLNEFGLTADGDVEERIKAYVEGRTNERKFAEGIADFHKDSIEDDTRDRIRLRAELVKSIATDVKVASMPGEVVLDRDPNTISEKLRTVAGNAIG